MGVVMNDLNNPDSEIFKQTLEEQKLFISSRLKTVKIRYLEDKMGCCGTKEQIARHLNMGPAQNLVQNFFNYKTTNCIVCKCKKGENNIKQIERAHCNAYSRYDLLMKAIDDLYIDANTSIESGTILKSFIQKHEICPIYMLCNNCHKEYDSKFTTIY